MDTKSVDRRDERPRKQSESDRIAEGVRKGIIQVFWLIVCWAAIICGALYALAVGLAKYASWQ